MTLYTLDPDTLHVYTSLVSSSAIASSPRRRSEKTNGDCSKQCTSYIINYTSLPAAVPPEAAP